MADPIVFKGLKVLDMSWIGVGPLTMRYLADFGATVIRVESVSRPDNSRTVSPFKGGEPAFSLGQFNANFNTSKLDLGLNLAMEEGRDIIRRLLCEWRPDVLAESFTPKTMGNWGLDYEHVDAMRPGIVYLSTCQQGHTGPHREYAGYGTQATCLAGFHSVTGWPDKEPVGPYGAYTDFVNPPNALVAVLSALEYRRRTGKGQYLDLSQLECAIHYLAPAALEYTANGRTPGRVGNRDPYYVPHGVYPCENEDETRIGGAWCAIAVGDAEEWRGLVRAMGSPTWAVEERFATPEGRREHEDELDARIAAWTKAFTMHDLMRLLQEAGVPSGAVQAGADLWTDPQLKHRGYFRWLDHPVKGPMPYEDVQAVLSKTPGKPRWASPLVGQDNDEVLKGILGMSDVDVAGLAERRVIETA